MKKYLNKVLISACVLLLPVISYLILGPLEVFFGNAKDFAFSYSDFLGVFLMAAAIVLVAGGLLLAVLPQKINGLFLSVILGVGVASYIQNMFMNIKLSENDGSPMDWSTLGNFPIVNLLIWILVLAAILVLYLKIKDKALLLCGISGFLSLIQLVAVVSLFLMSSPPAVEANELHMHGDKQFNLSAEDNIVVFVLDTFGNTKIENLLLEDPDALEGLEDFTYYSNMDCGYYTTFPSVTHYLTGIDFDFEANSVEWMRSAWNSERADLFYDKLHDMGYTCNLYSDGSFEVTGEMQNLYGKFDNVQAAKTKVDQKKLIRLLGKISTYCYVPYVIKPYFEVLTQEFGGVVSLVDAVNPIYDNPKFYDQLISQKLSVDDTMDKTFVIQHLFGLHAPYTTGRNAEFVEESTVEETTQGLIYLVNEYLDQMKQLGVYDDATIIIMADHGGWWANDPQPIFMIKQPRETNDVMPVNAAPVSLSDFQSTILTIIGSNDEVFGTSIFDWNEKDTRERTVYMRMDDPSMPVVPGSYFNAYYGFTYSTDKHELIEKMYGSPEIIKSATPW